MTDLAKLGNLNHFLPRDFNPRIRDDWIASIAKNIPDNSTIIDISAGNRPYKHLFSHCIYKSHEFDGNKDIMDSFRGEQSKNKDWYHDYYGDINSLPIPNESFDYVLCTEVLEHVPEPIKAIKELVRICKKGGKIIITTPFTSGIHQEPHHFYSGFSPYFYEYVGKLYNLQIKDFKSQGDFFKLMSWFTNLAMQFRLPESHDFEVNTVSHYMQSYYLTMSEVFGDSSGNIVETSKHFTVGYMIIFEKSV